MMGGLRALSETITSGAAVFLLPALAGCVDVYWVKPGGGTEAELRAAYVTCQTRSYDQFPEQNVARIPKYNVSRRNAVFESCIRATGWRLVKTKEEADAITNSGPGRLQH